MCIRDRDDTYRKGCRLRSTGNTLCTLNDDNAVRAHAKGCGILDGKTKAVGIHSHIQHIDKVLDDLAECKGYDSQIVTL